MTRKGQGSVQMFFTTNLRRKLRCRMAPGHPHRARPGAGNRGGDHNFGRRCPRPARSGWTGVLVVILGTVALTACNSDPAASSGSNPPSSAYTKALAFAKCMRSHGLPNYPDPNSKGQFVQTGGNGPNVSGSILSAAQSACQSLMPSSMQISSGQRQQMSADALKFAECMRSHGVPSEPDPGAGGEVLLPKGTNPNAPTFQNAERACQSLMPQQAP